MLNYRTEVVEADVAAIRRIVASTRMFREHEIDVAEELIRERLAKGEASGYYFIYAYDAAGDLMGYICYGPIAVTLYGYDIYWIVVAPDQQGKGVGRSLMAAAQERMAQAGGRTCYLETSSLPSYEGTRRFYERCGYRLEARVRDFYAPGDDKLIYSMALVPS